MTRDALQVQQEKLIQAVNLIFDSFEKHKVDDLTAFCALRTIQKQLEKRLGFKVEMLNEDEH